MLGLETWLLCLLQQLPVKSGCVRADVDGVNDVSTPELSTSLVLTRTIGHAVHINRS
jgi:hypothetical protein